jgi:hypothetical protein
LINFVSNYGKLREKQRLILPLSESCQCSWQEVDPFVLKIIVQEPRFFGLKTYVYIFGTDTILLLIFGESGYQDVERPS